MSQELTQDKIKRILTKHFPNQKIKSINRITEGYSHYMYDCELDKKNVILRISFNKKDDLSIGKEIWVINQYKKVGVPVPEVFAFETSEEFDYMIIQKFNDQNLGSMWDSLNENDKIEIAKCMGKLLKKMHSVTFDKFGHINQNGLKHEHDFSFRKQSNTEVEKSEWIATLFRSGFKDLAFMIAQDLLTPEQSSKIVKYLHSNVNLIKDCKPVLTHTDFVPDHLFVKKENNKWNITGIIDFEFAYAYAPEFDFIKLHRLGILDNKIIKKSIIDSYGAKELHKYFDKVVLVYRVIREIGFAGYVANAGNLNAANKAIDFILKTVNEN